MNIISVDFSKRCTGVYYRHYDGEGSFIITNKAKVTQGQALMTIYREVTNFLIQKKHFDIALIEKIFRGDTFIEICGVITLSLAQAGIPIVKIPVQTWKSVTGFFRLDKKKNPAEYLTAVKEIYKHEFKTTDEADAFLIYQGAREIMKLENPTKAAAKVRKQLIAILSEYRKTIGKP
jgi:hypothetical protein